MKETKRSNGEIRIKLNALARHSRSMARLTAEPSGNRAYRKSFDASDFLIRDIELLSKNESNK